MAKDVDGIGPTPAEDIIQQPVRIAPVGCMEAASHRPRRRAHLSRTPRADPHCPRRHPGRNRLAHRHRVQLAVDLHHPGDHRLRHLSSPGVRRCRHRARDRLRRRARPRRVDRLSPLPGPGPNLHQRCKTLQKVHPESLWALQVKAVLQTGLDVRDRCNAGQLSEHGLASIRGRLEARLGRLSDEAPPIPMSSASPIISRTNSAVFLFLYDPSHQLAGRPSDPRWSSARVFGYAISLCESVPDTGQLGTLMTG